MSKFLAGRKPKIKSWKKFGKIVRSRGCHLLDRIDEFPDSVLISGCQRSGGTMLANVITHSEGMVNFAWSKDDELDAAQILSGYKGHDIKGRHCFQTTFLNECYTEYFSHNTEFKLIWLLRNPHSVVYSLLHNWSRFALNELFSGCGFSLLPEQSMMRYQRYGYLGISRLERACYSYNAKILQASKIINILGQENIMVVDYNDLVTRKHELLPMIYSFINLPYQLSYADSISTRSLGKSDRLSKKEKKSTDELCMPVYNDALKLLSY